MSDLTLLIDGTAFGGWTSVELTRSMEEAAGSFQLQVTDRWPGSSAPYRPIREHTACTVMIDGIDVLTGIIDRVAPKYDANTHTVAVSGRSLPGQLIDCSCEVASGELRGLGLAAIARKLAAPFGIEVVDLAEITTPFPRVTVEKGETVFEVLERLARQRGVFLTDDATGRLVIRRRSTALQGVLNKGENVLAAEGEMTGTDQYSHYKVLGQREGRDGDDPGTASRVTGVAVDASVPIHRPKLILGEAQGDGVVIGDRAGHEAALRRARARRWTYTLQGWHRPDGALWTVGEEVEATDDFMGFDRARLLVADIRLSLTDQGEITELTIAPPEGYDLLELRDVVKSEDGLIGWDDL